MGQQDTNVDISYKNFQPSNMDQPTITYTRKLILEMHFVTCLHAFLKMIL
jgi:hypothetical protein